MHASVAESRDSTPGRANVPIWFPAKTSPDGEGSYTSITSSPAEVAGVVLFDPTIASFARMFDDKEFRPAWDGTASAGQVERVTSWPDIPFEILLYDPAVYADQKVWSDTVEALWGTDQALFAALAPRGAARVVPGAGHNIYIDAPADSVAAVRRVLDAVAADG